MPIVAQERVAAAGPQMVGRFELRRVLGKGAQATVWLGYDPRLDREVAVKLMRAAGPGGAAPQVDEIGHWLQEARSVSRLVHAHIVPVFEADVHREQPYLVFEYVAGATLSEHLRRRGKLPANEAVVLMIGVLDALQTAHAAGVVHRDLKPSNILLDAIGRARVMDFGIAARVRDAGRPQHGAQIVGTPGYMSPEAADGRAPGPAMDVFAAGLVLVELLAGKPLVAEKDPYRAIYRVAHEDLALPSGIASEVDDRLRALLLRAIARDPARRIASAGEFRDALQAWLAPVVPVADPDLAGQSGTLDFLLRRMRHKSDFPALSDSVLRIQKVANSENESLASLSNEILKDVALTNKLLRLVNTAHYSAAGGGNVSTVSRAVALIGFAGIRNMAMSLVLLEHMHDKAHAVQLKEEFLRALMAGALASELNPAAREGEEAFIGAMFQNLGRLLTEFYFPEEARQIRGIVEASQRDSAGAGAVDLASASFSVLGLSFEDLGLGVAKTWGLPPALQSCMRRPPGEPPARAADKPAERLRWLARAANDITEAMLASDADPTGAKLAAVAQRYAKTLSISTQDIETAVDTARQRLVQMAQAMNLQVAPGSAARRLLGAPACGTAAGAVSTSPADTSLTPHELHATQVTETPTGDTRPVVNPAEVLAAGVQDITNSMVDDFKLNDVLRMILETMFRALGFRRIVFCLRDAKTDTLTGRFGLGEEAAAVAKVFQVPLKGGTDLFAAVCAKGVDTLISDAGVANIAARLPAWYTKSVNAPAFLLLPLAIKGAAFALIYADKAQPGGIELGAKELALLRTLRNQAVMAFRQAR
jgi:serine/threonine protein kinase